MSKRYFICENCTSPFGKPPKAVKFARMQISGANFGGIIADESNLETLVELAGDNKNGISEVDEAEYFKMRPPTGANEPKIRQVPMTDVLRPRKPAQPPVTTASDLGPPTPQVKSKDDAGKVGKLKNTPAVNPGNL